jgi:hypothetical protein
MLAACGFLPPSQQQEFSVSSAVPTAEPTPFNSNDPKVNDALARNYCADGYDHLDNGQTKTADGKVSVWRVSCAVHDSFPDF